MNPGAQHTNLTSGHKSSPSLPLSRDSILAGDYNLSYLRESNNYHNRIKLPATLAVASNYKALNAGRKGPSAELRGLIIKHEIMTQMQQSG